MLWHKKYYFHPSVDPVSQYSKYLVSSACKYEGREEEGYSSTFCPGYTDVMTTPYSGTKNAKLHAMAEVFCSYCSQGDTICRALFCGPDRQIVEITQTLLETFCSAIQVYFPSCYSEFCPASIVKRDTAPISENLNTSVTCKATSDWTAVAGMDQWCEDNCKDGNDHSTCLEEYCECTLVNGSEHKDVVQSNNLEGTCLEWEASLVWSNVAGMNTWCQNVCSVDTSCDPSYCQCKVMSQASTSTTTSASTPSTTTAPVTSSLSSTTLSSTTPSSTSASSTASSSTTFLTTSPSAISSTTTFPVTSSPNHSSTSSSFSSDPFTTTGSLKSSSSLTSLSTTITSFQTSTIKSTTPSLKTTTILSRSSPISLSSSTTSDMTSSTGGASSNSLSTTTESQSTTHSPIVSYSTTSSSSTIGSTTKSNPSSESSISPTTTPTTSFSSTVTSIPSLITSISSPSPSSSFSSSIASSSVVTSTQGTTTPSVSSNIVTSTKPTVNLTDKDSLDVIESIVCDHSTSQHHNILSDRHCKQSEESRTQSHSGYNSDILDQVFNFAPSMLCAFTSSTKTFATCPDMFCGDNPLSQEIIRTSICSICEMYSDVLASSCVTTYCQ